MGSFNVGCSLTGKVIEKDDEVVMILMTKNRHSRNIAVHSWDFWSPIPLIFEGKYDSYGGLEDVELFQSKSLLDNNTKTNILELIVNDLKEKTVADRNGYDIKEPKNFNELMTGNDWSLIIPNIDLKIAQGIMKIKNQEFPEDTPAYLKESFNTTLEMQLKMLKVASFEELESYIEKNKGAHTKIPLSCMYFHKNDFLKLVNTLGINDTNKENYAPYVQGLKNSDLLVSTTEDMKEILAVMNGNGNYSGANSPKYTYANLIKEIAKNSPERESIFALEKLQALDLTILNNYFTMLGKTFQPSMYVSEEVKSYGYYDALEMQKELLNTQPPVKKTKVKIK